MFYLIMLFMTGGDDSPITAFRYYENETFQTMEECISFYEADKDKFNQAAGIFSKGRHWKIVCGDQGILDQLEELKIEPQQGTMI